ncbi:MAG: hypothetical protein FWG71_01965, partial [Synergistaceae bacterium]|nr:hypothetical protein [Synergistaceae bacterium]
MFEKNKKNGEEPRESGSSLLGTEGKVFGFWSWILPLLLGLTAGWFGMACLEVWLEGRNGQKRPFSVVSSLSDFAGETDADNMAAFLRTNPFNVTPMPVPEFAESEDEAPPQIVGSLATAVLKGTSPGYMAWMEDQGRLRLVMLGASFDVYTLEEVTYLNATFVRDGERVVKEIMYGGRPPAPFTERRP